VQSCAQPGSEYACIGFAECTAGALNTLGSHSPYNDILTAHIHKKNIIASEHCLSAINMFVLVYRRAYKFSIFEFF